jgi:hypothetical protein
MAYFLCLRIVGVAPLVRKTCLKVDGTVKSPDAALRGIPRHCGVLLSTLPTAPAKAVFLGICAPCLRTFYGAV